MRDINAENQIENILVEEEEDNYNLNYENTNNCKYIYFDGLINNSNT